RGRNEIAKVRLIDDVAKRPAFPGRLCDLLVHLPVVGSADDQKRAVQISLGERAVEMSNLSAVSRRAQRFGQLRADDGHAGPRFEELERLAFGDRAAADDQNVATFEIEVDRVVAHRLTRRLNQYRER